MHDEQAVGFVVLAFGTAVYARGDEADDAEEGLEKTHHVSIKGGRTIGLTGTARSVVIAQRFIRR